MDVPDRGFAEFRRYVNPLIAQRAGLAGEPVELMRAVDGVPHTREGQPIEDFHGTQSLGHRNPQVAAALSAWLQTDALSWYPSRVSPYAGRLARRLAERTGYDNAWFGASGTDAVEAAIKLARAKTGRTRVLSMSGAYHGCTYGSCSLMEPGPFRDPFGPFVPGLGTIPFGDVAALKAALSADDVAAVIVEPVQVEGGVRPLPDAYIEALCALTEATGTLLIADEVQTGLGRGGRGFLYTASWPRRPDVVLLAKALGGGLMPLSAMLTHKQTFLDAYGRDFATGESHNATYSFNTLGMVAGLAMLEQLDDALFTRVAEVGGRFLTRLRAALEPSPLVAEVRGTGLMFGIVLEGLDHPWLSFEHFGMPELSEHSTLAPLLCHRLYSRGFFCFTAGHDWSVMRIQPRLNIDDATLDRFIVALTEELAVLEDLT